MSGPEERETFVAQLTRAYPTLPVPLIVHTARALMSAATTYGNLMVEECNGWSPGRSGNVEWWAERERTHPFRAGAIERRIGRQLARLSAEGTDYNPLPSSAPGVEFGGDPRGYTVKLMLPNRAYNTMGGAEEGYGVPGS